MSPVKKIESCYSTSAVSDILYWIGLVFRIFADYVEYYQEKIFLFVFSSDYLNTSLTQPGSILVYLGRFLTTFYYYPVAGAIIISAIIFMIILMISEIISILTDKSSILLSSSFRYRIFHSAGKLPVSFV